MVQNLSPSRALRLYLEDVTVGLQRLDELGGEEVDLGDGACVLRALLEQPLDALLLPGRVAHEVEHQLERRVLVERQVDLKQVPPPSPSQQASISINASVCIFLHFS